MQRFSLHLLLALCLVFGVLIPISNVLCVGMDGHVEIESAFAGGCSVEVGGREKVARFAAAFCDGDETHCGPCVDTPLLPTLAKTQTSERKIQPDCVTLPINTCVALSMQEELLYARRPIVAGDSSSQRQALVVLRSVTLLI